MKYLNSITVELQNKVLAYNGVNMEYDFIAKTATTTSFPDGLELPSDYSSPLFAPDRGIVIESDDPAILIGDLVILEYYVVCKKLGTSIEMYQNDPHNEKEVVDGKVRIHVRTRNFAENYVYAVFRNGEWVPYKDWNIVVPVEDKHESELVAIRFDKVSQQLTEVVETNKCKVLYGEFAGKVCLYDNSFILGEAQKSIIDNQEVRFINSEYLFAEVEEEKE